MVQCLLEIAKFVEAISELVAYMDVENRVLIQHECLQFSLDFLIEVGSIVKLVLELKALCQHRFGLDVLFGAENVLLVLGVEWRTVLLVLVGTPTVIEMTDLLIKRHCFLRALIPEGRACSYRQDVKNIVGELSPDTRSASDISKAIEEVEV